MIRFHFNCLAALVLVMAMVPAAMPGESADGADHPAQKVRHRLPNYFGQIGLSDRQREKIYALQDEYNAQIAELQAKIEELERQRDAKIEGALTDAQKIRLRERREEARRAREARRAAREG